MGVRRWIAQGVEVLDTKPYNLLDSIPGTHVMGGNNQHLQVVLTFIHVQ